jgi:hypothetical protein
MVRVNLKVVLIEICNLQNLTAKFGGVDKMKIDLKSAFLGFVLGALLLFVLGIGAVVRDYGPKWGLIVPSQSKVLVRDSQGRAFLVDSETGSALIVEYDPRKTPATVEQLTLSPGD